MNPFTVSEVRKIANNSDIGRRTRAFENAIEQRKRNAMEPPEQSLERMGFIRSDIREKRMDNPVTISFRCPEGMDRREFERQLRGQERGLNSQTISENVENRDRYVREGRAKEGAEAQRIARQKAEASRIQSNMRKGMSVADARIEAKEWIGTQAALHNPDQIAGGNPEKVSRMGDARVNSSIGRQWRDNVSQLSEAVDDYSQGKSPEELTYTKLNVKLVLED